MNYVFIIDGNISGKGQAKILNEDIINIEVDNNIYNNIEKYIYLNGEIILNPEYNFIELNKKKKELTDKNDKIRDFILNSGVIYKDIIFDSDTDQKTNLLATYPTLSDEETITWYGRDNDGLECSKNDLLEIGKLIRQLHSYCWNRNAEIKKQIYNATTLKELESVDINYDTMDNR